MAGNTGSQKSAAWIRWIIWSLIIAVSLFYNLAQIRQRTLENVLVEATIAYEKDLLYRRWVADFGGVYVPTQKVGEPNPYLATHPRRDLTTTEGLSLTLINPAWMARMVHDLSWEKAGALGRITSLNPLQPVNSPDSWERSALMALERGKIDTSSIETMDNKEYFRLMKPLIVEESCMECHSQQGYVVGDIRGGMSVSIPLAGQRRSAKKHSALALLTHILIWSIGVV